MDVKIFQSCLRS